MSKKLNKINKDGATIYHNDNRRVVVCSSNPVLSGDIRVAFNGEKVNIRSLGNLFEGKSIKPSTIKTDGYFSGYQFTLYEQIEPGYYPFDEEESTEEVLVFYLSDRQL